MKKFFSTSLILLLSIAIWGCKDGSTGSGDNIEEALQERQFVWDAMNYWYFWQTDVPELTDDMAFFDDEQDYHDYLMGFADAEAVFEDLLFKDDNFGENNDEDDFSFFIEDYEEFLQSRQGISNDFGFEYGLVYKDRDNSNEIFGYVQYVLEDSPADAVGLERGHIFSQINGSTLTDGNYRNLLANSTYELTLADYNGGDITENGETITVQSAQLQENPILISKVIDAGPFQVGYLLYNSFQTNSHEELNNVFGEFSSTGIDELVLDLRYNGGGSVITSQVLTSMISGLGDSDEFGEYSFNSKRAANYNQTLFFRSTVPLYDSEGNPTDQTIPMNTVQLNQMYVLTGFGTASASESVINSLKPFMTVIVIGRQTVGKDDVSITLYDSGIGSEFLSRNNANPNHKYALQPIIAKIVNEDGESNNDGFEPDYPINELSFLDDLPPLGEESDPLLAKALELITGAPVAKAVPALIPFPGEMFKDSRDLEKFAKEMYLVPGELSLNNADHRRKFIY